MRQRRFLETLLAASTLIGAAHRTSSCFITPIHTQSSCRTSSSCSNASTSPFSPEEENRRKHFLPSWLETPIDSDARHCARPHQDQSLSRDQVYLNDWAVEKYSHPKPCFPDSLEAVTHAAWEAIAGTLYGKQRLDPNVASNAMSRTIYGYRPVRATADKGRIGIEIDGAQHIFQPRLHSEGTATRRVALELAAKLSARPWKGFEEQSDNNVESSRPVAVYFNTIKQSLVASKELMLMKRIASEESSSKRFDNITIHCLQQGDDVIPKHMHRAKPKRGFQEGDVDPTHGLVLVVQPTDYNSEFRPPGPSIDAVGSLQRLSARASCLGLPVIVISPRFLAHEQYAVGGWDQSGYQQSSVYGGAEPPKGPTPWLLRDFTPPVFSHVGNALSLSSRYETRQTVQHVDNREGPFHYSRVVCTQSVMEEGHPFHLFAVKEYDTADPKQRTSYQYLASTKTSSGRPPKEILRHVFNEWS